MKFIRDIQSEQWQLYRDLWLRNELSRDYHVPDSKAILFQY